MSQRDMCQTKHVRKHVTMRCAHTHSTTTNTHSHDIASDPGSAPLTPVSPINRNIPLSEYFRHNIIYYQFHTLTRTQRENLIFFNVQYYGWKPTKPIVSEMEMASIL